MGLFFFVLEIAIGLEKWFLSEGIWRENEKRSFF